MSTQSTGKAFNDFHCVARVWSWAQLFPKATLYFTSMSDIDEGVKYDPRCFLITQRANTDAQGAPHYMPLAVQRAWVTFFGVFVFGLLGQHTRSTGFFVHRASPHAHLLSAFLQRMSTFELDSGLSLSDYFRRLHVLR